MSSFDLNRSIYLAKRNKISLNQQQNKKDMNNLHTKKQNMSFLGNEDIGYRFLTDIYQKDYISSNEDIFNIGSSNQKEEPKMMDILIAYYYDVNKWYADLLLPNRERYKLEEYNKKQYTLEQLLKDDIFILNAHIISNIENIPSMKAIEQLETYIKNKQNIISSPFKKTLNIIDNGYKMMHAAVSSYITREKDGSYKYSDTANEYKTSDIRNLALQDKDLLAIVNAIKTKGNGISLDDSGTFPIFVNIQNSDFNKEVQEELIRIEEEKKDLEINPEKLMEMGNTAMGFVNQGASAISQVSSAINTIDFAKQQSSSALSWITNAAKSVYGGTLGKLTSMINFFSGIKSSIGKISNSFSKHVMKHVNTKNGLIMVGVIVVVSGAIWLGKMYADRKKALKELFRTIDEVDKKLKEMKNIANPKSRLSIEQVADISNGIGSLLLYTNSVLGISEYINSANLNNFEKELDLTYKSLQNNNLNNDQLLETIVKLNIAFNPVNGEIIKIVKEVQNEVLTEMIPMVKDSKIIISSLVNGIIGYNVYFDNGVLTSKPFMILEKSSVKVANILESANLNELQQVSNAVRTIIKQDDSVKKTIEKISSKYTIQPNNNASMVVATAMMAINDYYGVLPKNATTISNILNMYLNTIQR